jgi:hypothetical protein
MKEDEKKERKIIADINAISHREQMQKIVDNMISTVQKMLLDAEKKEHTPEKQKEYWRMQFINSLIAGRSEQNIKASNVLLNADNLIKEIFG